jgi:hypothetical protein
MLFKLVSDRTLYLFLVELLEKSQICSKDLLPKLELFGGVGNCGQLIELQHQLEPC